jgi:hypothetical protein
MLDLHQANADIHTAANTAIAEFIRKLPETIHEILRKALLEILGLREDNHAIRATYASAFVDTLDYHIKALVKVHLKRILKSATLELDRTDQEILRDALSDYKFAMRAALKASLDEIAKQRSRELANQIIPALDFNINIDEPDQNPDTPLSDALIELAAKKTSTAWGDYPDSEDFTEDLNEPITIALVADKVPEYDIPF